MAVQNPLEYDSSYYDFLKSVRNLPKGRYAARLLEWEDYVEERAREVLKLALRHPNEAHMFTFASLNGSEIYATLTATNAVDASVWQDGKCIYECLQKQQDWAREEIARAIMHHRFNRSLLAAMGAQQQQPAAAQSAQQ